MAEKEISGYQELKLILSNMEKGKYQIVEMKYVTLLKLLNEFQKIKYQKNMLIDKYNSERNNQQLFLPIIDILRDLKRRGEWIEYKNKTVHTKEFYRIEKETLEKIIEEKAAGTDPKKVLDIMANLGILRKQGDKILSSAPVEGVTKRIYMVRIDSVDNID